jgi:DNA-binding MarR family transcriptional regulator
MTTLSLERAARDVSEQCIFTKLRMAARAVTQHYDETISGSGIRATQFSVLIALAHAPVVPLSKLADTLVMDRTTLTRNLTPLIREGLIEEHSARDRRVRAFALTALGKRTLSRALPGWKKAQAVMLRALSANERDDLTRILNTAVRATREP